MLHVRANGAAVIGHRISAQLSVIYSPRLRSVLTVEANTFDAAARALFVTQYAFGELGSLSLVLSQDAADVNAFVREARVQALLKLTYGFTAL